MNVSCGRRPLLLVPLVLALALVSAGCGPRAKEFAKVKGQVTFKGKPVTAGSVTLVALDESKATGGGVLDGDGKFNGLAPVGRVKLTISTTAFKPQPTGSSGPGGPGGYGPPPGGGRGGPPGGGSSKPPDGGQRPPSPEAMLRTGQGGEGDGKAKAGKYVAIPEKYEKVETTDLEFDIKSGENDLGTIDLKGEIKK